jgi:hypothetical protein
MSAQMSLLDGGCETTIRRHPELTIVPWPAGWWKLPVRTESQLAQRRGVCVTGQAIEVARARVWAAAA